MPINACSINSYTTDSICKYKRAKYIEILFGTTPPVEPDRHGHPGYSGFYSEYVDNSPNPYNLEQSTFMISIVLDGQTYSETYENLPDNFMPFISINKLSGEYSNIKIEAILKDRENGI